MNITLTRLNFEGKSLEVNFKLEGDNLDKFYQALSSLYQQKINIKDLLKAIISERLKGNPFKDLIFKKIDKMEV